MDWLAAIADDISASDPDPSKTLDLLEKIETGLASVGLTINRSKSELIRSGPQPQHIIDRCASLGIKIIDADGDVPVRILGSPFGNAAAIEAYCGKKIEAEASMFKHMKFLHPQLGYSMLRISGIPSWRFLASTTPSLTNVSENFDSLTKNCLCEMLKCQPDDIQSHWLGSSAGAGLTPYAEIGNDLYAESVATCAEIEATGIAKRPTKSTNEKYEARLRATFPDLSDADATSSIGNNASRWLRFLSHDHGRMRPGEFIDALRLRCRIPLVPGPLTCFCGTPLDADHRASTHLLRCNHVRGETWSNRHDATCGVIARSIASAGCHFIREPRRYAYGDASAKRPDITAFLVGQTIALDVTIVTPEATPGKAASTAAAEKQEKHAAAVEERGDEFLPLAFESGGHADKCFETLCRLVGSSAQPWAAQAIQRELRHGVSTAIAAGNARIVRMGIERLRRTASYTFSGPSTLGSAPRAPTAGSAFGSATHAA